MIPKSCLRLILVGLCPIALTGCHARFQNDPLARFDPDSGYRLRALELGENNTNETFVFLAFSGGGTRAAAFSYGVLKGLSEIENPAIPGGTLLEEVDVISSVSGGSFTALAYGLWHDDIFNEGGFRKRFLETNIQLGLFAHVFNPFNIFTLPFPGLDSTDLASMYYDKDVFLHHTYDDLKKKGRPLIVAQSTDMSRQTTFAFVQSYFDLLGSDLSSLPVGWAAAASSAFPLLLSPLRMNYYVNDAMKEAVRNALAVKRDSRMPSLKSWAQSLLDNPDRSHEDPVEISQKKHRYLYMLDGGLADNLGLHSFIVGLSTGDLRAMLEEGRIKKLLLVIVDAGKPPAKDFESHFTAPGVIASAGATASTGIYNNSLIMTGLMNHLMLNVTPMIRNLHDSCKAECPGVEIPPPPATGLIDQYLAHVNFTRIARDHRADFQKIKTSFSLPRNEVEQLIEEGRRQIKNDPQIRKLIHDLNR